MTSGMTMTVHKKIRWRVLFFLFTLSSVSLADTQKVNQDIDDLQQLLSSFSHSQYLKLSYKEQRTSLFFKQPQHYTGYIEYISPDTFIKHTETPEQQQIIIQDNQLKLYRNINKATATIKTVSLDNYPKFKQIKALFSGLFQGNAKRLSQYFQYKIQNIAGNQQKLILTPLVTDAFINNNSLKNRIHQQIDIIIHHKKIESISMTDFSGEKSELIFIQQIKQQE